MTKPMLRVNNLTITQKAAHKALVSGVQFSLEPSKILTLLGQSGSGKTMTCRAILGLLNRHSFQIDGEIEFEGTSLLHIKEKERRCFFGSQIAFIPQNPMTALDPSSKIGRQMVQFLRLHQKLTKQEALSLYRTAMAKAGLTELQKVLESRPGQLSGGMLQRALIALALAQNVKLIIADEPTTALDALHKEQTARLFLKLKEQGCAILLVTHDFDVVQYIGGEVLVMKDGQMIERGFYTDLLQHPKAAYTKELIAAINLI